ncbi:molybdopterin molybdotransferase MoeA [Pseudonocardia asaccharolytica]|uniref:Molybdopterin molybdenumtransferase n=1 Tax=Pseudonocardia asaccharolytica DSM 44247 = NBRC 16224 TaxID=1123024 RepID=A0A511D0K1_9PSEU|nr:gephyrin-like molybdotransferase Glp [Pseudonocardia asaccharolytica]GEL17074.1 molybdopterin molybdenumtransferase [Pseudonocardia asaccharolytica DSM 44247 = NBRC 16224]
MTSSRPPRSVAEHQAVVAALVSPAPVQGVPLAEARGLVLSSDLISPISLPPFDNSAMDGYAVRAADVAGASAENPVDLPVGADIPAGRTDVPVLEPGTAHRIMTGAPLPAGADAVVQVELTDRGLQRVRVLHGPPAGAFVRRAGEDVAAGAVVLTAGTILGASQIGLAAAVGSPTVAVRRPPHVLVLSTGSELVAPGTQLQPGQIYESNGPMLAAAVQDAGAHAELLRFVPDDVAQFTKVLDERIAEGVDLVLTSGGVSAGAYEVVKDALAGRGVEFVRVAMQPGGPQGAGRLDDSGVAVVTLPGNPVSSQVSFEVFVRPVLRAALGHPHPRRPVVTARLQEPMESPEGKRQFRRGTLDAADGTVREVGTAASHLIGALAKADCLIVLPEQVTAIEAGAEVEVWLLDG